MCRQNHGVAVDYYALGVIAYEFMMGSVQTHCYYFRGLIGEKTDWKLETKFLQSKYKSNEVIFLKVGQ